MDQVHALKLDGKVRIFDASAIDAEGWMICHEVQRGRCHTESHQVDVARWMYRQLRTAGWTPCDPTEADEYWAGLRTQAEAIEALQA